MTRQAVLRAALIVLSVTCATSVSMATTQVVELSFDPELVDSSDAEDGLRIRYPGAASSRRPGGPDLPTVSHWVEIPAGMTVHDVRVVAVEIVELGTVQVAAAAAPQRVDAPPAETRRDAELFAGDTLVPSRWAQTGTTGWMRGHRMAGITVHPLRWNPTSGRLVMARRMELELELEVSTDQAVERHRVATTIEARFDRSLARLTGGEPVAMRGGGIEVADPGPYQPTFRPTPDGSAVEYVIITNEALAATYEALADWKTRKGVQAVVRTVEWIDATYPNGVDRAERVRFFIRDAYQNWGTLWILLGGDTDVVPPRYAYSPLYGGESIPADYYFMCLEGTWNGDQDDRFGEGQNGGLPGGDNIDMLPEVYVGRAPTSTPSEAEVFVNKITDFERTPPSANGYPASILFLAERLFTSIHGADVAEQAITYLPPWFKVTRLYEESSSYPGSIELNKSSAVDSVNNGFGIVHHVGHGYRNTMSIGHDSLSNNDADAFTNDDRQAFLFAINCSSVSMDYNAIAERWVKNEAGGAIGYYGTSRFAFVSPSETVQEAFYSMAFEDSIEAQGELCALARLPLLPFSLLETSDRWTVLALNFLGDPESALVRRNHAPLVVTHAASHGLDAGALPVTVTNGADPVGGATVTLWKADDSYVRATTDVSGVAMLPMTARSAGNAVLTAYRSQHVPYEATVALTDAVGPYPTIEATLIDDDGLDGTSGDADGEADAGELLDAHFELTNQGAATMTGVTAALSITGDDAVHVQPLVAVATYPDLAPGASAFPITTFRLECASDAPAATQPILELQITATEGSWTRTTTLPIQSSWIEYYEHTIDDSAPNGNGNGVPEGGETITYTIFLRNTGTDDAPPVTGELAVLDSLGVPDPLVTVIDDASLHTGLTIGSIVGEPFVVAFDPAASPETNIFEVRHRLPTGATRTELIELVPPAAPAGGLSFGSETTITLRWTAPADEDVVGYDIYRSPVPAGPFVRVNAHTTIGGSIFEDSNLPPLTPFYYRVLARDASHNASPLGAVIAATTNPPAALGWPIEMGAQSLAALQMADLDGDGIPELFTASDLVYAWYSNGIELVDGDANPLTLGVFTLDGQSTERGFGATPAIADVDQNSKLEVCNVSWSTSQVFLWDDLGQAMPGWPQSISGQFNWASPVLADVDGDQDLEVIVWGANGGKLYAWHHDGTEVADGDGVPQTNGVLKVVDGDLFNYSSPAVGNLDADPEPEIAFCSNLFIDPSDPRGGIWVINGDGTDVPGWPVFTGSTSSASSITASPVIGDFDGDGLNELIVLSERFGGLLHVFNNDGSDLDGWPIQVPSLTQQNRVASPVVADIDADGQLDIVYPDTHGDLWVFDRAGDVLPGFPVTFRVTSGQATESTPAVADIDSDGKLEIVFGDEGSQLHAYNHDGTTVAGFPIRVEGEIRSTPLIADLDGDGLVEIGLSCYDSNVYMWDLPYYFDPYHTAWQSFRGDAANTGTFGRPPEVIAVDPQASPLPTVAALHAPVPNPFNPFTRLRFDVPGPEAQAVELTIYDVRGRLVRRLVDDTVEPGQHETVWDGRGVHGAVASGTYFVEMRTAGTTRSQKLVLAR